MTQWRALRQTAPENAIAGLREQFLEQWPYYLAEEPGSWSPTDAIRSEVARVLAQEYGEDLHWPAALALIAAPHPTDVTAWLNSLSLAHRVVELPLRDAQRRVVARAATLLAVQGLAGDPLVAFETVNILGGMEEGALLFNSDQERRTALAALDAVVITIADRDLRADMKDRATSALASGPIDPLSAEDAGGMEAAFRSLLSQRLRPAHAEIAPQLNHLIASLRAFAESQVRPESSLGAVSVRVAGNTTKMFGSAFGMIDKCLRATIEALGKGISITPVTLVNGSVEVVFHLEDKEKRTSDAEKDADGEADNEEGDGNPIGIGERLDRILTPSNDEAIPVELGRLLGEVQDAGASLDLEFRSPDGRVSRVRVDPTRLGEVRGTRTRYYGMIKSIDVPQANDLGKVFEVAEVSARGEEVKVVGLPGIVKRQWDYYRHAARILGLITPMGTITPAGLQLARTKDPAERLQRGAFLFEASEIGQAWMEWAKVQSVMQLPVEKEGIDAFIRARTEATGSTAPRRAHCLKKWVETFQEGKLVPGK